MRTFDPTFLNTVINHPEVRPHLEGEGPLDITEQALNPENYMLVTDFGGFFLMRHEPGRYEVHSQFLPGNGTHPIKAMRQAQDWMFTRTDCEAIVSKVPHANKAAKGLARAGGLTTRFANDKAEFVELGLFDWIMRTPSLAKDGREFHEYLERQKAAHGSELATHDDDDMHDRVVGAAFRMIRRGQAAKGVRIYNRWARQAGYAEIKLISEAPVVIDVIDAVLGLEDDNMRILLCR